MTVIAWIFFRAENITHAFNYISTIFSKSILILPKGSDFTGTGIHPFALFSLLGIFILIEWTGRESQFAIENFGLKWKPIYRWSFYYLLVMVIFLLGAQEQEFIYFQF